LRGIYLGDSYDLVKRFWAESLRQVAPLHAHPRFVPLGIRAHYTSVTSIPVLDTNELPDGLFGVLLDPHTGIPQPSESSTEATASHAPLLFIMQVNVGRLCNQACKHCHVDASPRRTEIMSARVAEQVLEAATLPLSRRGHHGRRAGVEPELPEARVGVARLGLARHGAAQPDRDVRAGAGGFA
jgi:hypothetical protein